MKAPGECRLDVHWQSTHPLKERIIMFAKPLPGATRRIVGVFVVFGLSSSAAYIAWAGQATAAGRAVLVDLKVTITDTATREFRVLATRYLVHSGEEIDDQQEQTLAYACTPYLPDADGRVTDWRPLLDRGIPKPVDDEITLACTIREDGAPTQSPVIIVTDGQPGSLETTVARRQYRLDVIATTSPERIPRPPGAVHP